MAKNGLIQLRADERRMAVRRLAQYGQPEPLSDAEIAQRINTQRPELGVMTEVLVRYYRVTESPERLSWRTIPRNR